MPMIEYKRIKQLEKQGMSQSEALHVVRVERERQLLINVQISRQ